jgi:N-acetylglucosaminyldiphosphoundecaprenol N-acetyl-beta-D-mannosaminyltransferase
MTDESQKPLASRSILGVNIAVSSYDDVVQRCLGWAQERHSRALFFAAVHMVMEAADNPAFLGRLNDADVVFPDGMPLVWALRALGRAAPSGSAALTPRQSVLAAAEKAGIQSAFMAEAKPPLILLSPR